jgi:RNA polymerase sigma-70 factor (ECF subfamily)
MKDRSVSDHQQRDPNDAAGSGSGTAPAQPRIGAEALFRAHAAFVAGFLHRLGAPKADVDDLVQEVFLIAHRKGGYVPGAGQPRTWLGAIALRVALAGRRTRARRREDNDELGMHAAVSQSKDPAQSFELRASLERVQRALDTLDLDHRAAFVLYEIEGESCDNIAAAFDLPVGTVYSRLHHARKRFLAAHAALDPASAALPRPRLVGGT